MKLSLFKEVSSSSALITQANVNFYELGTTDILETVTVETFSSQGLAGSIAEDGTITNTNFKIKYAPRNVTSLEISTNPTNGVATTALTANTSTTTGRIISTGSWTYTPNDDWYGTDTFVIQANLTGGGSVRQTVTVVVFSRDDAIDQTSTLDLSLGDNFVDIVVSANDLFESDDVSYAIAAGGYPEHGSLSVTNQSSGTFRYTPDNGFTGTDQFTYRATASGISEAGVVTIVVI
jgi:hypothetical protein